MWGWFSQPEWRPTVCNTCQSTNGTSRYQLPGIRFNFMKGEPFVCEKCIYTVLVTATSAHGPMPAVEWNEAASKYIHKYKPEDA